MIPAEPRDGGIAEDRDGDLWRPVADTAGLWFSVADGAERRAEWAELVAEYGPLDVYVWRARAKVDGRDMIAGGPIERGAC